MKKEALLFVLCLSLNMFAQKKENPELSIVDIGEFAASGSLHKAKAYIAKDTSIVYFYELEANLSYPSSFSKGYDPKVIIACKPTMKDSLIKVCEKYKEWTDVARKSSLDKFEKKIDVTIPFEVLVLNKKATGYPKYIEWKDKKFTFFINGNNKTAAISCTEVYKADYGMRTWSGLSFTSVEEFEKFVEFLDPEKVKQRLKSGITTFFK